MENVLENLNRLNRSLEGIISVRLCFNTTSKMRMR